jgi:hypothetical protein
LDAQSRWRGLKSAVLVATGDAERAASVANEAVALARDADVPMVTALALTDLAAALQAGASEGAAAARGEAVATYVAKGDFASAGRLQALSLSP